MSDFPKFGQQSIWMLALNVIYFMPFLLDIGLRVLAYEGSFATASQRSYVAVVNIYAVVSFIDYFGLPTFDVLQTFDFLGLAPYRAQRGQSCFEQYSTGLGTILPGFSSSAVLRFSGHHPGSNHY